MLQRYDITRNDQTNRLSIKEFAVLETKSRKRDTFKPIKKDYALLHEVSYDSDILRAAIGEGQKALIVITLATPARRLSRGCAGARRRLPASRLSPGGVLSAEQPPPPRV